MALNKVMLIGNLGQDPELRYTQGGQAVGDLRVATSRKYTKGDGTKVEDTQWHTVVVWGKTAENCKEYLSKGRSVFVEGRLQTRSWKDDKGNKRYTTEVVAQRVDFLGGGNTRGRAVDDLPPAPPANIDRSIPEDDIPF